MIGEGWINAIKKDPVVIFLVVTFLLFINEKKNHEEDNKNQNALILKLSIEARDAWKDNSQSKDKMINYVYSKQKDTTLK